ncbi:MAG: gluconate 2-dehydrogenase subunit 3 family protein [Campylobacterales bacterium]|nr:gluconate 2-dehydrogenase subunit 3 family protein [Campylobacterales bacterium]
MKRRNFIKFTTIGAILFSTNITVARTIPQKTLLILDEIFNIIFPKTTTMPSAKEFKALEYLIKNISHKTFENEDKVLILDGTKDFNKSFSEFLTLNQNKKKELIFEIIKTSTYAKSWVSKLTYYGIEAMLSDPIYGGNFNQIAWNSVKHPIGIPRPLKTYGQKI